MKKILISGTFVALGFLLTSPLSAAAQTRDYQYSYTNSNTGTCVVFTQFLAFGSRDTFSSGEVTSLQQFLNRTNYLKGITGYYDQGTVGAVTNYQRERGITPTGTLGPVTRSSITQETCNGAYSGTNPTTYGNPTFGNNSGNSRAYISSLSNTSGTPGSAITIYGNDLSNGNPTLYFDGSTIPLSYSSNNGVTFTVPYLSSGTYQLYLRTSNGSSNSVSFTILRQSSDSSNCYYSSNNQCGCNSTNYSSGTNNTYYYNYSNSNSNSYSNCTTSYNNTNSYPYYNNSGTIYGTNDQPRISSISGGTSASTGSLSSWSVTAYSQTNQSVIVSVDWGDGSSQDNNNQYNGTYSNTGQQTYSFSHRYLNPGTYTMRFTATDNQGRYAYSTQQVSVYGNYSTNYNYTTYYGSNGTPNISYVSPSTATRGSTIVIYGSNFSSNNTVQFGNSTYNVGSFNNGTAISFVLPYIGTGTYDISVRNGNGQISNSFTVYVQ